MHSERITGNGSPLIMLHGWGHSLTHLKPLAELLADRAQIHLIDLPGFGQSPPPDAVWSSFDYADRIIEYMNERKIAQADLLGHSFGGKVALSLAIRYPKRVRRLILISSSGLKRKRSLLQHVSFTAIKWTGKACRWIDRTFGTSLFDQRFAKRYGSTDYNKAGAMRPILVRSVNEDMSSHLSHVCAPTLLLWGENDTETPLEMGVRMQHAIPKARLIQMPYKGHIPFQEVGSHLCARHILTFLGESP